MIRFDAPITLQAAEGEDSPKTIAGVAVPWEKAAVVSDGTRVRFERGAFDLGARPKLLEGHDITQLRGVVTELQDAEDGLRFQARFANTRASNDAIALVKLGAYDSVSIGADPIKFSYDDAGTMVVSKANLVEISLVALPAFKDAVITEIAASAEEAPVPETQGENPVSEEIQKVEAAEAPVIPTQPVLAASVPAQPKSLRLPSAGEYIMKLKAGGHEWAAFNDRIHAAVQAAQGDVVVSDAAGVIPTPIVSPVYDDINALRPIVSALGARSMPEAGATFIRPYVKVHSAVAAQSSELANLTNADFEVDDIVVTKKTFGGRLYLSEQVIDWSAPSMLDQAISDLAGQYALQTEKYVVDQLAAAVTNTQEVINTTSTSASELISDMYTAASSMASTGNYLPNAVVVSPAKWAVLGSLVDGQNRPLFPQAAPMNSVGTLGGVTAWNGNPLGLQLVVSNQVGTQAVGNKTATEYYWLLNTRGVEVYEQQKGLIRLENPDQLGLRIAFRGYFAAHVIDVNMVRIIGPDATFS